MPRKHQLPTPDNSQSPINDNINKDLRGGDTSASSSSSSEDLVESDDAESGEFGIGTTEIHQRATGLMVPCLCRRL